MTKLRDIARILSRTEASNPDNQRLLIVGEGFDSALATPIISNAIPATSSIYQTHDSLPTNNLSMGDTALVVDSEKYYFSDGNIWYSVGVLNEIPDWDAAFSATYEVADEDTNLVVSNTASDSDDPTGIFTYSGEVFSPQVPVANTLMTSITVDSDAGTWTFNAAPEASVIPVYDADGTGGSTFKYIFRATDGINTITDSATIDWTFPSIPPITYPAQTTYGGQTYGYFAGGASNSTNINRWSLSSTGNAASVGDLDKRRSSLAASGSSGTYGYGFGGSGGFPTAVYPTSQYYKYQFASGTNIYSVSVATYPYPTLTQGTGTVTGNRSKGYNLGSRWPHPSNSGVKNYADRITYSSDAWSSNVLSLTNTSDVYGFAAHTSPTSQYKTGGAIYATSYPYGTATGIKYFPFSSETDFADQGYDNLWPWSGGLGMAGASSTTYGYTWGGVNYQPSPDTFHYKITKYPFANNANATEVGDIYGIGPVSHNGVSSRTHGFGVAGATAPWNPNSKQISKFPFSSDASATDIGDLVRADYGGGSGQY